MSRSSSSRRVLRAGLAGLLVAAAAVAQPARIEITEAVLDDYARALTDKGALEFATDVRICFPGTDICVPDWMCDPEMRVRVVNLNVDVTAARTRVSGLFDMTYCGRIFPAFFDGRADLEISADDTWLEPSVDIDTIQPFFDFPFIGRISFPPVDVGVAIEPTPVRIGTFFVEVATAGGRRRYPAVPRDPTIVRLDGRYRLSAELDFR